MRVLAVDDDVVMRELLLEYLEQRGHDTVLAADGNEALALFKTEPFPVLISDWMMPGMDGLELTRRLRRMELNTYCYIILLTGREGAGTKRSAMEAGVDAFLSKPLVFEEMDLQLFAAERILSYLAHIRKLESLVPVCCLCKKIKDDRAEWHGLDEYLAQRDASLFHNALCPECLRSRVNPDMVPPGMAPE